MNETTNCVTAHEPQRPQNNQYHSYGPQHGILLSDCPAPLPAVDEYSNRQGSYNLFGLESGRLERHPVLDTLTNDYAAGRFGGQLQISSITGRTIF